MNSIFFLKRLCDRTLPGTALAQRLDRVSPSDGRSELSASSARQSGGLSPLGAPPSLPRVIALGLVTALRGERE